MMNSSINSPVHGNNFVDGINATEKCFMKSHIEILDKLASNNASNT